MALESRTPLANCTTEITKPAKSFVFPPRRASFVNFVVKKDGERRTIAD